VALQSLGLWTGGGTGRGRRLGGAGRVYVVEFDLLGVPKVPTGSRSIRDGCPTMFGGCDGTGDDVARRSGCSTGIVGVVAADSVGFDRRGAPATDSVGPKVFRGSGGVGDKGVSGDGGVVRRSGLSSRVVGVETSVLVVPDASEGPAMSANASRGCRVVVAPTGRGGTGGGGPRRVVVGDRVIAWGALGSCGGWNASPEGPGGVGRIPRVEGSALPLGDVAAGAASSGRLRASGGVVRVALGDVSLWDTIPRVPEGGGDGPGGGEAIPLGELAAGWATPSRCGNLGGVAWGGLGPPETRGDGGSGLGTAGREVVEIGPGGMVVPRYLGTGDGSGLGVVDSASLGAVGCVHGG
jgi:hypothetical protein